VILSDIVVLATGGAADWRRIVWCVHGSREAAAAPAPARSWLILAVVSTAQFLCILDLWVVNIAFPTLQAEFRPVSLSDLSWVLNAYTILLTALLVPAGRLADVVGRRTCFLGGLVVFGVASLGCSIAPDLPVLVGFRGLQSLGAAVLIPTSLGLVLPVFPPAQRATVVGVWAAVGAVAAGGGPVLGGLLVTASWRWIFLINLPVVVAALVAGARLLPRGGGNRDAAPSVDVRGTLLVLAATALVCTGLTESAQWGATAPRTLAVVTAGLLVGAALAAHVVRHPGAVIDPALLRVRVFAVAAIGILAYYAGFGAMLLADTLFLTGQWKFSVLQAALGIAPGPIFASLVSPLAGRVARSIGKRSTVLAGAALFAAAGAWPLATAAGHRSYLLVFLPGLLAWGGANGLIQPTFFTSAGAVPAAQLALGSAVLTMARQLGSALGVALLIGILGGGPAPDLAGFQHAWLLVVATAVATAVAGLGFAAERRTPAMRAELSHRRS
jgi:EmrB/QacA subfamily drug resistance transporter